MSQPALSVGSLNQWQQLLDNLDKGTYLYQDKNQNYFIASSSSEKKLKCEEILNLTRDFVQKAYENAQSMKDIGASLKKFKNRMKTHYDQKLYGLAGISGLFFSCFQFDETIEGLKFSIIEMEIEMYIKATEMYKKKEKQLLKVIDEKKFLAFVRENANSTDSINLVEIQDFMFLLGEELDVLSNKLILDYAKNFGLRNQRNIQNCLYYLHFLYHPEEDFKDRYETIKSLEKSIPVCFKNIHNEWLKELESKFQNNDEPFILSEALANEVERLTLPLTFDYGSEFE